MSNTYILYFGITAGNTKKASRWRLFLFIAVLIFYRAVLLLKLADTSAYEPQYLPVCRPALVFRYVVELSVELGVDLDAQMLVVFVSHIITKKS